MRIRPRRLRKHQSLRQISQEAVLNSSNLIYPMFVLEGEDRMEPIQLMPGQFRLSIDNLIRKIRECIQLGLNIFAIFPVIDTQLKDESASLALHPDGLILRAIAAVKREFPEVIIITDLALDPYTSHGHDGLVDATGYVLNDETVSMLCDMALLHASAGADIVAPSDMMDGRVGAIRDSLEAAGHADVVIISYAAKYASSFYGPFRDAVGSELKFGDKKTYQLNPANRREALTELALDELEGADILMVKPGLPYLDVIAAARGISGLPIFAYCVSGEYAMLESAAAAGMLDRRSAIMEAMICMRRAGADGIVTYHAPDVAAWLRG